MSKQAVPVLYIEDEPKVASSVKAWLEENGFKVEIASDGAVGRHLATTHKYEIILLDINLPYLDGYEVCRAIRLHDTEVPIILITALDSIEQKLSGFEAGADDYLVKPFDFRELLVRIKAHLKRTPQKTDMTAILRVGDLEINRILKTVSRNDNVIDLTAKEFALLDFLVRNKGRIVSRYEIIENVWDINFDTGTNVVEVYINFLRKKIDRNFDTKLIHTKQGMGYYIKE